MIKLLVTRLRQAWAKVRIVVRGDSGFCRQRLLRWCERHDVGYVIGVARNARLHKAVAAWEDELKAAFADSATPPTPGTSNGASLPGWSLAAKAPTLGSG